MPNYTHFTRERQEDALDKFPTRSQAAPHLTPSIPFLLGPLQQGLGEREASFAFELGDFVYLMNIATQISVCHSNESLPSPASTCEGGKSPSSDFLTCLPGRLGDLHTFPAIEWGIERTLSTTAFKLNCWRRFYHRI